MFGWRKKNDGFEWHKYVRTTIKLKRADRRRRVAEAQGAAAAGLKQAGRHGAAAGRSLAAIVWHWLVIAFFSIITALRFSAFFLRDCLRALARMVGDVGQRCGVALWSLLRRIGAVALLIGLGMLCAGGAYVWKLKFGADRATLMAEGIGLALIALGALVALAPRLGFRRPAWLRLPRWLVLGKSSGMAALRWTGGVVAATALIAGGWWLWPGLAKVPGTQILASLGGTTLTGRGTAVTGDALRIAGRLVRLSGIESPDLEQRCGLRAVQWPCGRNARSALAKALQRGRATCSLSGKDDLGRDLAHCTIAGQDVARGLVSAGHVFGGTGLFQAYSSEEQGARAKRLGIWRGPAQRPSEYRSRRWAAAKADAPGGCPIKGQLRRGARTYVTPWQPEYERARVREAKGERWFCSEAEARAAGWRPVENS